MPWPWTSRSQVAWVDLYTRQSLYVVHWVMVGALLLTMAPDGTDHPGAVVAAAALGLVANLAAAGVMRELIGHDPATRSLAPRLATGFVGLVVLTSAASLLLPSAVHADAALLGALALVAGLGGLPGSRAPLALVVGSGALALVLTQEPRVVAVAVFGAAFGIFTIRMSLWLLDVVTELDRARGAQADLAVAEERLRFSRDVHDVLGRQLSTIAVQAELAASLAGRGDARAAEQMLEVRATAHEALREARELARGYRATSLEQELEGARSLLRSAGIRLETEVADLPAAWHEAAGWVVREGVTNVLRHSAATTVALAYDGSALRLSNDRPGPAGAPGSGLVGLGERLRPLGARLAVDHDADRFTVEVALPERPQVGDPADSTP